MKTITLQSGDTLSKIAGREYGDINLWPIIAQANPGITDPNKVYPGQTIKVPDMETIDVVAQEVANATGDGASSSFNLVKLLPWILLLLAAAGGGYYLYKKKKGKTKARKK